LVNLLVVHPPEEVAGVVSMTDESELRAIVQQLHLQNDHTAFLREIQAESDRGAALVGAAIIDERLVETLRAFMVSNKAASSLLDGGNAPLGTFSSRIDAAFALALIDAEEHRECHIIRKIRNEFAHSRHGLSFADKKISDLCRMFKTKGPPGTGDEPRFLFNNAVILISTILINRADYVAKEKRVTRFWPLSSRPVRPKS
jgi:mannitol operon repressor